MDPGTLEGAFARMAEAAESGSVPGLFAALDDDSRGSVSSIHRVAREAKQIVERDFPAEERPRVAGRWRLAADGRDPIAVFEAWCADARCMAEARDRLSSISRTVVAGDVARVKVRRGREYPFARSRAGRWGLSLFRDRLSRWKVEVFRDLDTIRASAKVFGRGS